MNSFFTVRDFSRIPCAVLCAIIVEFHTFAGPSFSPLDELCRDVSGHFDNKFH